MSDRQLVHLVDDDDAIRHSASFMLRAAGYRVQTYADGVTFLDIVETADPGCILLDVQMPHKDGLTVLAELGELGVDMPVVVLTGHGDVSVAVAAMKGGAVDFVEKPYEKSKLLDVIGTAFEKVESREMRQQLAGEAKSRLSALTDREHEVLEGLVQGLTNKAIAHRLSISPRTVEIHRSHVMEKLEVNSLSSALRLAFAAGMGFDD
jgi:two-component system, LuxR family, response regulator FixJ